MRPLPINLEWRHFAAAIPALLAIASARNQPLHLDLRLTAEEKGKVHDACRDEGAGDAGRDSDRL